MGLGSSASLLVTALFSRCSLQLRSQSGTGEIEVTPRSEESRCTNPTTVAVGNAWGLVEIDVAAASCLGTSETHGLTISCSSAAMDLLVDEIRYE